ncbi:MAG: GUN4 domain-containing protein [Phormidesmis sp.]
MAEPSHQSSKPPFNEQVADIVLKVIMAGSFAGGGFGAFWSLFKESDLPKAIASAVIGVGLAYGAKLLLPVHKGNERRLERAGKAIEGGLDQITERAIASATGFEGKYLRAQASDCESVRSEGVRQREGLAEPLLKDVFVELQIDSSASLAGFETQLKRVVQTGTQRPFTQSIWDLLVASNQHRAFRQMAILAWGGYGKTTLLKHVAYCYGSGQAPKGVPKLVPVLLALRKYRKQLMQAQPPSLPELINQYHIPSLPESHQLQPVPPNWARNLLRKGRTLVLLDGFDEIPQQERPVIAKWIHTQMRQYAKSVFVVTSRPKAYKDQDASERLELSTPLWVQPFDQAQRRNFIENWYLCQEQWRTGRNTPEVKNVATNAAQSLIEQIEAEEDLRKMAKNPLLLTMIARFHQRNSSAPLPKRQSDLYGEVCTLQLKDRPRARGLQTVLTEVESQSVLGSVALAMMQQVLKRIDGDVLRAEIKRALREQDEAVDADVFLEDVVQISELIVQQEDEYEFAHLSFQEYLAAAYIAEKPDEREAACLYNCLQEDWWKATILLYAGKIRKPAKLIKEALRQGATELAYECSKQTRKQVDEPLLETELVVQELRVAVEQAADERYADLERYLNSGKWKEADNETYRLMITEVGKEVGQWFVSDDLLQFPCKPLKVIDRLWVKHSDGRFGFSVQKDMYLKYGGVPNGQYHREAFNRLCEANGWTASGEVHFDAASPCGHLPFCRFGGGEMISSLAYRLVNCNL